MDVGNEMEIFITLTKYNTRQQRREEDKPLPETTTLLVNPPLTIMFNVYVRNGTYPLMFIWKSILNRGIIFKYETTKKTYKKNETKWVF